MASPKISILSAVYNENLHIEEMMQSVKDQSFIDYEHIIIDDQSTDDTYEIASSLINEKTRILRNPRKGKVAAFNYAFQQSKGEWIVLLAGDDTLPKDSLMKRYEIISDFNSLSVKICIRGHLRSFSNKKKFDSLILPKHKKGNFTGGVVTLSRCLAMSVFDAPTTLPNEDTWLELCAQYFSEEILPSPGVVLNYRIHERNSSGGRKSFKEASTNYGLRSAAFGFFEQKYSQVLTITQRQELRSRVEVEKFRTNGQLYKILFQKKVKFLTKLSNIVHANALIFTLRQHFFRFVSGWR